MSRTSEVLKRVNNRVKLIALVGSGAFLVVLAIYYFSTPQRDIAIAQQSVEASVEALLKGDYTKLEAFQFGDELNRLGVSREELERYRVAMFDGYLQPDAKVEVQLSMSMLPPARNEYESKMQEAIYARRRTNPEFIVTIERADGKPPLSFPTYAFRRSEGWVVSHVATLFFIQSMYADDLKERYARVRGSLQKAGLDAIRNPSGSWVTVSQLDRFLRGEIDEQGIFLKRRYPS